MRPFLLCSTILLFPSLALAEPQCVLPAGGWDTQTTSQPTAAVRAAAVDTPVGLLPTPQARAVTSAPVLEHLVRSGSQISELSVSHGMRSIVARNGEQFMFFHVVPDGSAIVGGLISEISPGELLAAAGSQAKELGMSHGLRGIFVNVGAQFQVLGSEEQRNGKPM